jgi:DNA polymerase-3 subunit gamma/tau
MPIFFSSGFFVMPSAWPSTMNAVSAEKVEKAWGQFVGMIESEGQFNLLTTLKATSLAFVDDTITLQVLNKLQIEQIRETQLRLNLFFADTLENDELKLAVELAEVQSVQSSAEFMNDRERYDEMVKKNPALDELRKRLDLDLLG